MARMPVFGLGYLLLSALGACWLLGPRGVPARWLGGLLMFLPCFHSMAGVSGQATMSLLDGQGNPAIVIRTAREIVWITPRDFSAIGRNLKYIQVRRWLKSQGLGSIPLALPLACNWQSGPGFDVFRAPVDRVNGGLKAGGFSPWHACGEYPAGERAFASGGLAEVSVQGYREEPLILRVQLEGISVLILDQQSADNERQLIDRYGSGLKSDVLMLSGRQGTGSGAILNQVAPSWVLAWAWPGTGALYERIGARGIRYFNASAGAVMVMPGGQGPAPKGQKMPGSREGKHQLAVSQYRPSQRFWHQGLK